MKIPFTKMHGLGNDFVILNCISDTFSLSCHAISQMADRRFGIGFDQLLIIESSKQADFYCRIYNADGSEAEQCGNGLRCVARYLHEQGLHRENTLKLATKAGLYQLSIADYYHIQVLMGPPQIQAKLIDCDFSDINEKISLSILSFGNPHAIVKVDAVEKVLANQLGPKIASHSLFPNGVNVGFMQVIHPNLIRLRTYERGVGETHACGSNACAASVAGIINGWLEKEVKVDFRYGSLFIKWEGNEKPLFMTGPAVYVYSGEYMGSDPRGV